jgi:hypothetical protein
MGKRRGKRSVIRYGVLLALILLLAPVACANAGEPTPICRVPSVLEVMAREVHRRDYYARIDRRLVDEFPDTPPNTVWCGVTVSTLSYGVYFADGRPLWRCEQYAFSVRALEIGFVVRYIRKGPWLPAQR